MQIKVREIKPSGKSVIDEVINRCQMGMRKTDDMRDTWGIIEPELKQAMRYTFSDTNPSKWSPIQAKYRAWKIKKGYPATIGILTGATKRGLTDSAIVKKERKKLTYGLDENVSGYKGKKTGAYAFYFNAKRNIMRWGRNYIDKKIKSAVKQAVLAGWKNVHGK